MEWAFAGPATLRARLGHLDAREDRRARPGGVRRDLCDQAGDPPVPGVDGPAHPRRLRRAHRAVRRQGRADLDGRPERRRALRAAARAARLRRGEVTDLRGDPRQADGRRRPRVGARRQASSATTFHVRSPTSTAWRRSGRCGNGRGPRRRRSWTSRTARCPPDLRSDRPARPRPPRPRPDLGATLPDDGNPAVPVSEGTDVRTVRSSHDRAAAASPYLIVTAVAMWLSRTFWVPGRYVVGFDTYAYSGPNVRGHGGGVARLPAPDPQRPHLRRGAAPREPVGGRPLRPAGAHAGVRHESRDGGPRRAAPRRARDRDGLADTPARHEPRGRHRRRRAPRGVGGDAHQDGPVRADPGDRVGAAAARRDPCGAPQRPAVASDGRDGGRHRDDRAGRPPAARVRDRCSSPPRRRSASRSAANVGDASPTSRAVRRSGS